MFVLDGPNAALGHNSAIYMIETQLSYVLGALDVLSDDGIRSLEVTADAEAAYTAEIDDRGCTLLGIEVVERVPLVVGRNRWNDAYLAVKRDKSGHLL